MIKAKVVDSISNKELEIVELLEIDSELKSECKELFSISAINLAIDRLNLTYKRLDECDVKNIIEYILSEGR